MRSMASVATWMAESKPKVTSVAREIVVDRLGHADDGQSFGGQFESDLLRAVAADDDEGVEPDGLGVADDFVGEIAHRLLSVIVDAIGEGIAAIGGAEDGSAARQDAADVVERERAAFFRPDEAVEAVADADDVVAIFEDGGFYRRADDRVESGTVSTPGTDADFLNLSHVDFF